MCVCVYIYIAFTSKSTLFFANTAFAKVILVCFLSFKMIAVKASLVYSPFHSAVNTNQSIKDPSFMMLKLFTNYLLHPRAADARMSSFFIKVTKQALPDDHILPEELQPSATSVERTNTRSAAKTLHRGYFF